MQHRCFIMVLIVAAAANIALAQRIAIFKPEKDSSTNEIVRSISSELSSKMRIVDPDIAASAFRSVDVQDPFNLSQSEARQIGTVVGCEAFLLFRTGVQRRAATDRPAYYEAFVASYIVDSRTGSLVDWHLDNFEAETAERASALLNKAVLPISERIAKSIKERSTRASPNFPEPPVEGSPMSVGLKTPVPYKRIKPEYTTTAFLYNIKATIDIEADINIDGTVGATSIIRWAGYGLDESVEKAVRSMNWRPAMRDGKPLPMRVLLRYNFLKVEKDEES